MLYRDYLKHRGGLEELLKGIEKHEVTLKEGSTLQQVIQHVKDNMLTKDKELFANEKTVYVLLI